MALTDHVTWGRHRCVHVCLPRVHVCVQQFLFISKVQRNNFLHSPGRRARHPHQTFPAFLAFLSQSILHQQLEKPTKLQELQEVSGLGRGGGDKQGRDGLSWGWWEMLVCQRRPLSLGSQGIPSPELAAAGGNSKPVAHDHVHVGPRGWAGPTLLRCGQLPPRPFDVTEMETHTCPTIN